MVDHGEKAEDRFSRHNTFVGSIRLCFLLMVTTTGLAFAGKVRVAVYNIHGGTDSSGNYSVPQIAAVINDSQADVVGLNEVHRYWGGDWGTCYDIMSLLVLYLPNYPYYYFGPVQDLPPGCQAGQRRQAGNAIFSKFPISNIVETSLGYYGWAGSSKDLLSSRVTRSGETFAFHVTHLVSNASGNGQYTNEQIDLFRFNQALIAAGVLPTYGLGFLVGDINADAHHWSVSPIAGLMADTGQMNDPDDWTTAIFGTVASPLEYARGSIACSGSWCPNLPSDHKLFWAEFPIGADADVVSNELTTRRPQAVVQSDGTVEVFWRTLGNSLGHKRYVPFVGWGNSEVLSATGGAALASDPSPVLTVNGNIRVFWKGANGNLFEYWYSGSWSGPAEHGLGPLGSGPKAVGWPSGSVDVFWRGTDSGLWHWSWVTTIGPGVLQSYGGGLKDDPAVSIVEGAVEVALRGTDDGLWHKTYGSWWGSYENVNGGPILSSPGIAGRGLGTSRIDMVWRGTGNQIYWRSGVRSGSQYFWDPYQNWGGGVIDQPIVLNQQSGVTEVFLRGTDNGLWHKRLESGAWGGFGNLSAGPLRSNISAVVDANAVIDVFWRDGTGALVHSHRQGGVWSGPERLAGL